MPGRHKILTRVFGDRDWTDYGICPHYSETQAKWWKEWLEQLHGDWEVKIVPINELHRLAAKRGRPNGPRANRQSS